MKPGRTANIRINSRDCMACIDVVQKAGINLRGASFSMIVSAALSSAMESFRQNGIIPVRDGFEYEKMMQDYPKQGVAQHARALMVTKLFTDTGPATQMPPVVPVNSRKQQRWQELCFQHEHSPDNMSEEEVKEMHALALELNPE